MIQGRNYFRYCYLEQPQCLTVTLRCLQYEQEKSYCLDIHCCYYADDERFVTYARLQGDD